MGLGDLLHKAGDIGFDVFTLGQGDKILGSLSGEDAAKAQIEAGKDDTAAKLAEAAKARAFLAAQAKLGSGYIDKGTSQATGSLSDAYEEASKQLGSGYGQAERTVGATGNRLADLYGGGLASGFQTDPGYQFRLKQGEDAIQRMASATGGRSGGATLKALSDYNQNMASNEFNNYANRTIGLAGGADRGDFTRAQSLADLYAQEGTGMSNLASGNGSQLAQIYANAGANKASNAIGAASQNTALAGATMNAYNSAQYAGGPEAARANLYRQGAGLGLAALI